MLIKEEKFEIVNFMLITFNCMNSNVRRNIMEIFYYRNNLKNL